jgi:hypothetical protein
MLGAWLAAKAETNGIGDSSADWRKSYSPNLEKANVAAAAVGNHAVRCTARLTGCASPRDGELVVRKATGGGKSEHAVVADGNVDQERYDNGRDDRMIQHPIERWLKEIRHYVIDEPAHLALPSAQ